jgi:hypothetical protein
LPEYITDKWPDEYQEHSIAETATREFNHASMDLEIAHLSIQFAFDKGRVYKQGGAEWIDCMCAALTQSEEQAKALRRVIDSGIALRSARIARAEKESAKHNFASGANTIA